MDIDNLRKMTKEQLLEEKKQTEWMIICCHPKLIKPKVPIGKRGHLKRRLARINTLLREMENDAKL